MNPSPQRFDDRLRGIAPPLKGGPVPAFHIFSGFSNRISFVLPELASEHHDYVPDPVAFLGRLDNSPAGPAREGRLYQAIPPPWLMPVPA